MPKEAYYFSHDYVARHDPKMINLQIKHGIAGIGCFWCIVEMLFEEGGEIPCEYERIAFELRMDASIIESVINNFGLFIVSDDYIKSNSVLKRLGLRNEKSQKAKISAQNRWQNNTKNANVLNSDANALKNDANVSKIDAIKERKGKERKRKEKKGKEIKGKEIKKVCSEKISENGNFSTEQNFIPVEVVDDKNKKKEVLTQVAF